MINHVILNFENRQQFFLGVEMRNYYSTYSIWYTNKVLPITVRFKNIHVYCMITVTIQQYCTVYMNMEPPIGWYLTIYGNRYHTISIYGNSYPFSVSIYIVLYTMVTVTVPTTYMIIQLPYMVTLVVTVIIYVSSTILNRQSTVTVPRNSYSIYRKLP